MPLNTTSIDLVFSEGVDTKTGDKNTAYTSFQTMSNSRYGKLGVAVPRGGFGLFATLPESGSTKVIADNDFVVTTANNKLYTMGGTNTYNGMGTELAGGFKRLYGGDADPLLTSVTAYSDSGINYVIHAWATADNATTGNVGISVYDSTSDRIVAKGIINVGVLKSLQLISSSSIGVYLLYVDSLFDLKAVFIDPFAHSTLTINAGAVTWANAPTATTVMRWAATVSGSTITVVYAADNAVTVSKQQFSSFGSAPAGSVALTFVNAATGITVSTVTTQGTATVMIAASDATAGVMKARFYTNAGALIGSEQTATVYTSTILRCWAYENTTPVYGVSIAGSAGVFRATYAITSSSIAPSLGYLAAALPLSGSTSTDLAVYDSFTEPTYGSQGVLKSVALTGSLAATVGVGMNLGQLVEVESLQLNNPVTLGTKTYFIAPVATSIDGFLPPGTSGITKTTLTVKTQSSLIVWDSAELLPSYLDRSKRQSLYIGGTARYLGATDRGGSPWPEPGIKITNNLSIVAGSHVAGKTISYVFAKVWKSAEGVEYRSYSTIYTMVTTAASTLQYILTPSEFRHASGPATDVVFEVYRTEENGTIFYLAETRTFSGTFVDASVDTAIIGKRTADINGNELPPQAIPTVRAVSGFGDRIALVSADKPSTVLFDRPSSYPVGTSFANGLEVEVLSEGGDITAVQTMDSCLYVFKDNCIFTIYGDPAGATGENSSLSTPKILFSGVGCIEPRSIVLTPKGILFKSGKGFYMIARNQAVGFVGAGPFDDLAVTVTGAAMAQNEYEVYFTHSNSSIWVLNLDTNAWYNWSLTEIPRGVSVSNGQMLMVTDTSIQKYSEALSKDLVSLDFTQDLKTGWVRMNHIRGYQRVRRAYMSGAISKTCTVTVQVFTDYEPTIKQQFDWSFSGATPNLQLDLHLSVQKCEAIQFRFYCSAGALSLSGGTLEVGLKDGPDKSRSSATNKS